MATLRNKKNWQRWATKNVRNILGAIWHKTRMFPDLKKDYINQVFQEIEGRVREKLSHEFSTTKKPPIRRVITSWRLSHEHTNSGPLRNRSADVPRIKWYKPWMMTTRRVILILKQVSSRARRRENLAQKTAATGIINLYWWDYTH